ncbi:Uncharacterised protein [Serratia quinivorans]|nr:Uncharacterised protein [Serratia quinivorans]
MPVLRTGIGPIYLLLSRKKEARLHNSQEKMGYMREHCITLSKDIGLKESKLLPLISMWQYMLSGLNVIKF